MSRALFSVAYEHRENLAENNEDIDSGYINHLINLFKENNIPFSIKTDMPGWHIPDQPFLEFEAEVCLGNTSNSSQRDQIVPRFYPKFNILELDNQIRNMSYDLTISNRHQISIYNESGELESITRENYERLL